MTDPDPQHCTVVIWNSSCDEQGLRKHHESRHVTEKKFKCEECPKSYATKAMLKVTRLSSHASVVEPESNRNRRYRNLLSLAEPECLLEPDLDPDLT